MAGIYGSSAEDQHFERLLNRHLDSKYPDTCKLEAAENEVFQWACEDDRDLLIEAIGEMDKQQTARMAYAMSQGDTAAVGEFLYHVAREYVLKCHSDRVDDILNPEPDMDEAYERMRDRELERMS